MNLSSAGRPSRSSVSLAVQSVLGVVLLAVGLLVGGLLLRALFEGTVTYGWTETACVIEASVVKPAVRSDKSPALEIRYQYAFAGRNHVSTQITRGMNSATTADDLWKRAQQLAPGTRARCFVNPAKPDEAVLLRASLWSWLVLLLPAAMVGVAGYLLVDLRRPIEPPAPATVLPDAGKPAVARWKTAAFAALVFVFGGAMLVPFAGLPLWRIAVARDWPAVSCEIVSSRVKYSGGKGGGTYSPEIVYRYQIGGRSYTAARYKFMEGSSSGRASKAEIVARFPPGSGAVCYVNPDDPFDAVIERGFTADLGWGLIPLIFVLIGAVGLAASIFGKPNPESDATGLRSG
jgi:hypothetical protein